MSAIGPTQIGGSQSNNTSTLGIPVGTPVPAGATIFLVCVTSAPDTAVFSATDTQANSYQIQSQNQPIGSSMSIVFFMVIAARALSVTDTITVHADSKFQILGGAQFYTNCQNEFLGYDLEYNNSTALNPAPICAGCIAQDNLFGMIVVNGPASDGFTQAPGWGPDIGGAVGNAGFSIHGGAMVVPTDGDYTYNPSLGRARFSVSFALRFR